MDKFNLAGLGGTFDHLHEGHKMLLTAAFKIAKKVAIAVCTDKLLQNKKDKEWIESYQIRVNNVENFIRNELKVPKNSYEIIPLEDPFGPAITSNDLEVHVSSEETIENSRKINQMRIQKGLKPLYLLMIPLLSDANGRKISSSEIREKIKKRST